MKKVIALYIGLCSLSPEELEVIELLVSSNYCPLYRALLTYLTPEEKEINRNIIALYIGLCSQQYLLLFFFLFYHFSPKKQAFLQKKWVSRFFSAFKKSSIYACFRICLYFFITLLSVDPLFYISHYLFRAIIVYSNGIFPSFTLGCS